MNECGLKRWSWGVGCVAVGLVACDPNTTEFETPGSGGSAATGVTSNPSGGTSADSGGTSADSGGTSADSGGTSADSGGTSADSGGTSADSGGTSGETTGTSGVTGGSGGTSAETSTTGAGGGAAIWPELPSERGTVAELDPYDFEASHCCSRAPEHAESEECPQGSNHKWTAHVDPEAKEITKVFQGTPATSPVALYVFTSSITEPIDLYLWETELAPPEGILALSPIYWIGASGEFAPVNVRLPFTTNQEVPPVDPFSLSPAEGDRSMLYFSADGQVYERYEGQINYKLSGYIEEPGFMFIGAQAGEWTCAAPGGEGGAPGE